MPHTRTTATVPVKEFWACMYGIVQIIYRIHRRSMHPDLTYIHPQSPSKDYLLRRYQLNASCMTCGGNGVGTSAYLCRATGWRRYTAAHMFWFTSRYRGM